MPELSNKEISDLLSMKTAIINGKIQPVDEATLAKRWAEALKKNGASTSCTLEEAEELIARLRHQTKTPSESSSLSHKATSTVE